MIIVIISTSANQPDLPDARWPPEEMSVDNSWYNVAAVDSNANPNLNLDPKRIRTFEQGRCKVIP